MSDEMQEQKTLVFKIPDGRTLTGTALLEMATLRDQFAMAALPLVVQAMIVSDANDVARMAYEVADAMLAARKEDQ